ncbi:uncharacterized protein WM277_021354 isoform 1-T1 [Molossus nigricans]
MEELSWMSRLRAPSCQAESPNATTSVTLPPVFCDVDKLTLSCHLPSEQSCEKNIWALPSLKMTSEEEKISMQLNTQNRLKNYKGSKSAHKDGCYLPSVEESPASLQFSNFEEGFLLQPKTNWSPEFLWNSCSLGSQTS